MLEALHVLYREGLLSKLRAPGQGYDDAWAEVLITEGSESEDLVLGDYPVRKHDALAKLDAMRAFVALTGSRMAYLEDYFRR